MDKIVLGNLFIALAQVLYMLLQFAVVLVIVRALASWLNPDPYNPIVRFLNDTTDPLLRPIRRFIPPLGSIDLSPLILLIVLIFIQSFVAGTLRDVGARLVAGG